MKRRLTQTQCSTALYVVTQDNTYRCTSADQDLLNLRPTTTKCMDHVQCGCVNTVLTETDEKLVWQSFNARRSVLLSGRAGSGKSHLLMRIVKHCERVHYDLNLALCAPTGVAAYNIGGETLHRKLGLGLAHEDAHVLIERVKNNRGRYMKAWRFLRETHILVIDEISMVHPELFCKLELLFRLARETTRPFGGVLLLMVGDFTQLGPVFSAQDERKLVFQTPAWQSLNLSRIVLDRSFRQHSEDPFLVLLNHVRIGQLSSEDQRLLASRMNSEPDEKQPADLCVGDGNDVITSITATRTGYCVEPVDIFPYRHMVDATNMSRLKLLESKGHKVFRFEPFVRSAKNEHLRGQPDKTDVRAASKVCRDRKVIDQMFCVVSLRVCVGAQVMMRSNHYMQRGVFNGSIGIVTNVNDNYISVSFSSGDDPLRRRVESIEVARIGFRRACSKTMDIVLDQFPLSLAWATTIHKVQGLTLDSVRLDARKCFEPGQFYVGLSRVRSLDSLILLGFSADRIHVNQAAIEFETVDEATLTNAEVSRPSKKARADSPT